MAVIWDYKLKKGARNDPAYRKWRLERLFTYGLNEKISKKELKKYWRDLKLEPERKKALALLLWPRKK